MPRSPEAAADPPRPTRSRTSADWPPVSAAGCSPSRSWTSPPRAPSRRGLVAALAVTSTAGYGVLYYAFGVLLGAMSADLRISTAITAGALTVAVLMSGAMSIPVGRWLDARGGRGLMTVETRAVPVTR